MPAYQLQQLDARLTYLAIAYHLGRPGSELEADAKSATQHGLREVALQLEPQLEGEIASIELDDEQRTKLLNAMSGSINELKAYPLMPPDGGRRHGTSRAFEDTLRRLFPEVADEPDDAVQLAAHLLALRRRLETSV
jgi:hypothetical protein